MTSFMNHVLSLMWPYGFILLVVMGISFVTYRLQRSVKNAAPIPPAPKKSDDLKPVPLNKKLYVDIVVFTLAAYAAFFAVGALTWDVMLWQTDSLGFNLGFPFFFPPLIHFFTSLREVKLDERGALYSFGVALMNVGPGLKFAPRGFVNLVTVPIDIQEIEEPGPRDKIFWGDEKEPLPQGMVRPIFVNSRSQHAGEGRSLDVQLQYGVGYFLQWGVSDDVATFLQNTRSLEEGSSQLKKVSLSVLDRIIGSRTTEGVIASQDNVADELDDMICKKAHGMGVHVYQAGLLGINLSHDMATSMRDRAKAQFEADTLIIKSKAEAASIRTIGEAEGDAAKARAKGPLEGKAEGMKKIKTDLGVSGEAVLASETLISGWPKSTVITEPGNIFGMFKAAETDLAALGGDKAP